jgi:hypothetical protein
MSLALPDREPENGVGEPDNRRILGRAYQILLRLAHVLGVLRELQLTDQIRLEQIDHCGRVALLIGALWRPRGVSGGHEPSEVLVAHPTGSISTPLITRRTSSNATMLLGFVIARVRRLLQNAIGTT